MSKKPEKPKTREAPKSGDASPRTLQGCASVHRQSISDRSMTKPWRTDFSPPKGALSTPWPKRLAPRSRSARSVADRRRGANSFDKAVELLFVFGTKRRGEMGVDLLMRSHFLAVECHDIFLPGGAPGVEDGTLGNRMGRHRFFGVNCQPFERGHRLKNWVIGKAPEASHRSRARATVVVVKVKKF